MDTVLGWFISATLEHVRINAPMYLKWIGAGATVTAAARYTFQSRAARRARHRVEVREPVWSAVAVGVEDMIADLNAFAAYVNTSRHASADAPTLSPAEAISKFLSPQTEKLRALWRAIAFRLAAVDTPPHIIEHADDAFQAFAAELAEDIAIAVARVSADGVLWRPPRPGQSSDRSDHHGFWSSAEWQVFGRVWEIADRCTRVPSQLDRLRAVGRRWSNQSRLPGLRRERRRAEGRTIASVFDARGSVPLAASPPDAGLPNPICRPEPRCRRGDQVRRHA